MEAQRSASQSPRQRRQAAAALCALTAAVIAAGLSFDIAYRLRLFWFSYGGKPGMNHVADDYFSYVYSAGAAGTALAFAAALMFRKRLWRATAGGLAWLNALLCAAFFVMHRTDVLVTYDEFVAIHGP